MVILDDLEEPLTEEIEEDGDGAERGEKGEGDEGEGEEEEGAAAEIMVRAQ